MKTKFRLMLVLMAIGIIGCSDDKPDMIQVWRNYWGCSERTLESQFVSHMWASGLILGGSSEWDEITYFINSPENYKIDHYSIEPVEKTTNPDPFTSPISYAVKRDYIDYATLTVHTNGKVMCRLEGSSDEVELFDYLEIYKNAIGFYMYATYDWIYSKPNFTFFENLPYPRDYILITNTAYYLFAYDEYGGYTIEDFGSTAGFFSAIQPLDYGCKRMVLQGYKIDMENICPWESGFYSFYQNREIPEDIDLPADFWKGDQVMVF